MFLLGTVFTPLRTLLDEIGSRVFFSFRDDSFELLELNV